MFSRHNRLKYMIDWVKKGYPKKILDKAIQKVASIPRESLLLYTNRQQLKDQQESAQLTFSTQYSPQFGSITKIIDKYLPMLSSDDNLRSVLNNRVRYVSKRASTLGSIVSLSLYLSESHTPTRWLNTVCFISCGHTRCLVCSHILKQNTFGSLSTGKTYKMRQFMNCNSKFVVYAINCISCSVQYVGCTTNSFKTRIRKHLSYIKPTLNTNVSMALKHFIQQHGGDTSSFKCMAIEKVIRPHQGGDHHGKLSRESFCIFELESRVPARLNKRYDILCHY